MDESARNVVFDAAMAELLRVGLDDFSVERVARSAGMAQNVLTAEWPDRRVLLMDTILTRAATAAPAPDTGSLRGDLQALADSVMAMVGTAEGRKWFHRVLPAGRDADLYEVGWDFWEARFNAMKPILDRAAARGELRADIDTSDAIRAFAAALVFDVTYHNNPVRPAYAAQVVEIFLRGITC